MHYVADTYSLVLKHLSTSAVSRKKFYGTRSLVSKSEKEKDKSKKDKTRSTKEHVPLGALAKSSTSHTCTSHISYASLCYGLLPPSNHQRQWGSFSILGRRVQRASPVVGRGVGHHRARLQLAARGRPTSSSLPCPSFRRANCRHNCRHNF